LARVGIRTPQHNPDSSQDCEAVASPSRATARREARPIPTPSAFGRRSDLRRTQSAKKVAKETFAMSYYVYILECIDGHPYTGCTDDLKERVERHNKGRVPATRERLPVRIVSFTAFSNKYKAFEFEKYLKSGSGRVFIKKHFL